MGKTRTARAGFWDFLFDGLWAEGILTFVLNVRFYLVGALVFVAIWTPLNYFSLGYTDLLSHPYAKPAGKPLILLAMLFIEAAQTYFFMATFINQQPIKGSFNLSLKNFFYMASIFFLLFLIPIAGGLAWVGSLVWLPGKFGIALIIFLILAAMICILLLRFIAVIPLAVNRVKSPLLLSWRITAGNIWRLAWNAFILTAIIAAPLTVAGLILGTIIEKLPVGAVVSLPVALFLSFVDSLVRVIVPGIYWAFSYSCCRILYGEYVVANLGTDRRTLQRS